MVYFWDIKILSFPYRALGAREWAQRSRMSALNIQCLKFDPCLSAPSCTKCGLDPSEDHKPKKHCIADSRHWTIRPLSLVSVLDPNHHWKGHYLNKQTNKQQPFRKKHLRKWLWNGLNHTVNFRLRLIYFGILQLFHYQLTTGIGLQW